MRLTAFPSLDGAPLVGYTPAGGAPQLVRAVASDSAELRALFPAPQPSDRVLELCAYDVPRLSAGDQCVLDGRAHDVVAQAPVGGGHYGVRVLVRPARGLAPAPSRPRDDDEGDDD